MRKILYNTEAVFVLCCFCFFALIFSQNESCNVLLLFAIASVILLFIVLETGLDK